MTVTPCMVMEREDITTTVAWIQLFEAAPNLGLGLGLGLGRTSLKVARRRRLEMKAEKMRGTEPTRN